MLQQTGDVKIFDFGLCKNLSPSLKAYDGGYGYRLTGQAGSLPYMAPEVVLCKTYDSKCDVFSFAILLWEILSLQGCCKGYTPEKFVNRVAIHQIRFPIQKSWPPLTRLMIPEAWDDDPQKRPDMNRVAILIRGDLNSMSTDDTILHRTLHMLNRSRHEFTT
jgi:serine/threonine protein kinase